MDRPTSDRPYESDQDEVPSEAIVLEPLADFPHIDLRTPGEPWEKRRAAGKGLRAKVPHGSHGPVPIRRTGPIRCG